MRLNARYILVGTLGIMALAVACVPTHKPIPTTTTVVASGAYPDPGPIMGTSRLTAAQLAAWVDSVKVTNSRPPVPVIDIARYFIEEGAREGVAGDVAFAQAILETGWFRFSDRMPPSHNNFSGIGAVDGGDSSASFPDARTGVRAQIQHLRAYADSSVNCSNFATTTVTPRCQLVSPKGKAPRWTDMGNGNWATDPQYAVQIASLYDRATRHAEA
jgi:hypothetical protein